MKKDEEFYIGWQAGMPARNKTALRILLWPVVVLLTVLTLLVVWFQKPFNNYQFALGNVEEITGTYFDVPIPLLEADPSDLPQGASNAILLVGYGKSGAEGIIKAIEKEKGSLNGKKVSLRGTLIHGDGKALLELTEKERSLVEIHTDPAVPAPLPAPVKPIALSGEILDPKCYFGVMKPGEGKIHKSCAIRCISGGIPPVFRAGKKGNYQYYILLGKNGKKINKAILPLVAEQIDLSGTTTTLHGWNMLYHTGDF